MRRPFLVARNGAKRQDGRQQRPLKPAAPPLERLTHVLGAPISRPFRELAALNRAVACAFVAPWLPAAQPHASDTEAWTIKDRCVRSCLRPASNF